MEAWEIEFSPQEVFLLMLFAIFLVKFQFSQQEVFPLM